MKKSTILILFVISLLLIFVGLAGRLSILALVGVVVLAVSLYCGFGPNGILRKEHILDTWATLIGQGQGKSEEIFTNTENNITESKAPGVRMEKRDMSPGIMQAFSGIKRKFLVITDQENKQLGPYQIFINVRDYGNNLDVSWYLTYRPSIMQSIWSLIPFVSVTPIKMDDLDLFDQQDLRAYVTNAHHCLLQAVEKLMTGLNQDFLKVDRKSKGFLGIS